MSNSSRPILHNGYEITDGKRIEKRLEKIYFTEIYLLSDNSYFYLFLNLNPNEIIDRNKNYNLIKVKLNNNEYVGINTTTHSPSDITKIIEKLTTSKGFDSVAGMHELKQLLINDVILPLQNPEKYEKFKLTVPNGILLFGPPGCGKTFIVRRLGEELGYTFIEVKHSDVASPYIHGSVGKIGKVFEMARQKAPSILFIDEFEGLVPKRENLDSTSNYKQEEINEFLMQLNDAGKNKILVVGATNRPNLIDDAVLRAGRMDKRIYVPPPDYEARKELFLIYLSGRPYDKNIDINKLAQETENYVSSDIELIVTEAARMAVSSGKELIDYNMLYSVIKTKITPSISLDSLQYYRQFASMERR